MRPESANIQRIPLLPAFSSFIQLGARPMVCAVRHYDHTASTLFSATRIVNVSTAKQMRKGVPPHPPATAPAPPRHLFLSSLAYPRSCGSVLLNRENEYTVFVSGSCCRPIKGTHRTAKNNNAKKRYTLIKHESHDRVTADHGDRINPVATAPPHACASAATR